VAEATSPEGNESVGEVSSETSYERLDVDAYKEHRVPIKVSGEESEVTLDELRSGYMRQADYTSKTQEVAALRSQLHRAEALMTAVQTDPQGTLAALADHYGISMAEAAQHIDDTAEFVDDMDPAIRERLDRIEGYFAQQQASAHRSQIDTEFHTLHSQFGEFDDQQVIAHALKTGTTVTDAYKLLHFEDVLGKANHASKEDAVVDAKRAAQIVETGGKARSAAVGGVPAGDMTLRETIRQALRSSAGS
jgi:deoxyribodipyrimidine photolyase